MPAAARLDAVCAAAVDLARGVLLESVDPDGATIGDHLGAFVDGDRIVTHRFECLHPGYRGWSWAVTLTRAPRSRVVTASESVLLPGPDALLAPTWIPYAQRLRPGDVGPGDLLPTADDDPRLLPGYAAVPGVDLIGHPGEVAESAVVDELGLGRARVLSPYGRHEAAQRWYGGSRGPESDSARSAPAACLTCGFLVRLSGPLGAAFGVCANEMSRSDGQVVSFEFGCGAHSELRLDALAPRSGHALDTLAHDALGPAADRDADPDTPSLLSEGGGQLPATGHAPSGGEVTGSAGEPDPDLGSPVAAGSVPAGADTVGVGADR